MKCPKCRGLMAPDYSYDVPATHCLNCGLLSLGERPVVMQEIPAAVEYSTSPAAVADRERRARKKPQMAPGRHELHQEYKSLNFSTERRRFTDQERTYIISAYGLGVSYLDMAVTLRRSEGSICSFVNRNITSRQEARHV